MGDTESAGTPVRCVLAVPPYQTMRSMDTTFSSPSSLRRSTPCYRHTQVGVVSDRTRGGGSTKKKASAVALAFSVTLVREHLVRIYLCMLIRQQKSRGRAWWGKWFASGRFPETCSRGDSNP